MMNKLIVLMNIKFLKYYLSKSAPISGKMSVAENVEVKWLNSHLQL